MQLDTIENTPAAERLWPETTLEGSDLEVNIMGISKIREESTRGLLPLSHPQYPWTEMPTTQALSRSKIRSSTAFFIATIILSVVISPCEGQNTTAPWQDILNNLGSDLAPLLALFGEQVTKQYLGESFSWVDNVIFALAPLGIITVVVSAIRVSGSQALRSLIGRSTESRGVVEADLMSSTSSDVCELWNGEGIVRVLGCPLLLQLVFETSNNPDLPHSENVPRILTFRDAVAEGIYKPRRKGDTNDSEALLSALENPPNLSLNVGLKTTSYRKQAFCVMLGIIAQGAVLAFAGVLQFRLQYSGSEPWSTEQQPMHAFWLFVGGTMILGVGTFGCAWIVETSTKEISWESNGAENIEVVWLQKGGQTVGDQLFEAFALRLKTSIILTSEKGRESTWRKIVVLVVSVSTVVGFILQFVASRMMNNLVIAAQLGAIMFMTAVRSWVHVRQENKKGIINPDKVEGHELDWLANDFNSCESWEIISGPQQTTDEKKSAGRATTVMKTRARLAELSGGWKVRDRKNVRILKNAIEETMREVYDTMTLKSGFEFSNEFKWNLQVRTKPKPKPLDERVGTSSGNRSTTGESDTSTPTSDTTPNKIRNRLSATKAIFRNLLGLLKGLKSLFTSPTIPIIDDPETELSSICLTLRREDDDSDWSPWRIDEKELEAVLCLWVYSLSQVDKSHKPDGEDLTGGVWIFAPGDDMTAKGDYKLWIHRESALVEKPLEPQTRYFGWSGKCHNMEQYYLGVGTEEDIGILCAQEVYARFMSELVKIIKDIGGDTTLRTNSKKTGLRNFCLLNTNLASLATIYNNSGLGTIERAYLSIIPPLRSLKKLPAPDSALRRIQALFINEGDIDERRLEVLQPPTEALEYDSSGDTVLQDAARAGLDKVVRWLIDAGADLNAPPAYYSGRTALQAAAEGGHENIAKILLEAGAVVNAAPAPKNGRTALQAAAGGGHGNIVKILLEKGAEINTIPQDITGITALQAAAESGHEDIVNILLKAGAHVNTAGHGNTALQAAAGGGHGKIVKILLKKGADINTVPNDISGTTALQAAAKAGYEEIVKILLEGGADVNVSNHGRTALQVAAAVGHESIFRVLLNSKADVNAKPANDAGRTALQAAAEGGHAEIVRLLLDRKAEVNALPSPLLGRTALQAAAGGSDKGIVEALLHAGADVNASQSSNSGRTAIQAAAEGGHEGIVEILLEAGADVNALPADISGKTALEAAAEAGNERIFKNLLDRGAYLNVAGRGGAVLQTAASHGHEGIVSMLLEMEANVNYTPADSFQLTALEAAVEAGHEGIVIKLLEAGADVNTIRHGRTVLQAAAARGHESIVKVLLDHKANVNVVPKQDSIRTVLHAAAEYGHKGIVKILLKTGADINALSPQNIGLTALQASASGGYEVITKMLLEAGADINAPPASDSGRTALQAAAWRGHTTIVGMLLQAGADVNAAPALHSGRTALQAAAESGYENIVKILLDYGANVNAEPALYSGRTALQATAGYGHEGILNILLGAGADVNAVPADISGRTALQAAAEGGYADTVRALLKVNANVNAAPAPDSGRTALQAAAEGGHKIIVNILLKANADVNAVPAEVSGKTALQAANTHLGVIETLLQSGANYHSWGSGYIPLLAAIEGHHSGIVRILLNRGADANAAPTPDSGLTAFQAASSNLGIIEILLEFGAKPLSSDLKYIQFLAAVEGHHSRVAKTLLTRGADVNASDPDSGKTALQVAGTDLKMIETLLEFGANPQSWRPRKIWLMAAVEGHHSRTTKILLDKRAQSLIPPMVLQVAARNGYADIVKLLLARGVNVNVPPLQDSGRTALQAASEYGHKEIVILLLNAEANINDEPALYSGRTALQAAAESGHEDIVNLLLNAGANINDAPALYSGRTALQAAAEGGHESIVKILLKANADVNAQPAMYTSSIITGEAQVNNGAGQLYSGRTALQAAARGGYERIVSILLDSGANVNAPPAPDSGRTALQAAAEYGHEGIVNILLKAGSDINAAPATISGRTALQAAVESGHQDIIKVLLIFRADVNAAPAEVSGRTALQAAGPNLEIVEFLLESGANPESWDTEKISLRAAVEGQYQRITSILLDREVNPNIHDSKKTALQTAVEFRHEYFIDMLLKAGANVNTPAAHDSGRTALQVAAECGYEDIVNLLLKAGANVNAQPAPKSGRTALQAAAAGGYDGIVNILLDAGADVNAAPSPISGRTALQASAESGNKDILLTLLRAGAKVNLPPAPVSGRTALQAAAEFNHQEIIYILLNNGAEVNAPPAPDSGRTALQAAAEYSREEIVEVLLAAGAEINAPPAPGSGRTALQAAAKTGRISIVKMLLEAGAEVNAPPAPNSGRTALQAAARAGRGSIVEILLEAGADANAAPAKVSGIVAIQAAASTGHVEIVEMLVEAGADVNTPPVSDSGRTALQAAARAGCIDTVELLLRAGADINAPPAPYSGRTALQAAASTGHLGIVKVLLMAGASVNAAPARISGKSALQAAIEGSLKDDFRRDGFKKVKDFLLAAGAITGFATEVVPEVAIL